MWDKCKIYVTGNYISIIKEKGGLKCIKKMQTKVYPPVIPLCLFPMMVACWIKRFPLCYFPYAKYSRRLHGSNRMGFALADSVSSTGRPMKPKQRLGEDWRGGRVKLIPANSGPDGINPICFYRMKITSVPLYLAATHFEKNKGARCTRRRFKRSLFPSSGAHSSCSPSFSDFARTHSAIWRGTYISQHLETYTQMGKPALPSACFSGRELMEAYPDHHACVK